MIVDYRVIPLRIITVRRQRFDTLVLCFIYTITIVDYDLWARITVEMESVNVDGGGGGLIPLSTGKQSIRCNARFI